MIIQPITGKLDFKSNQKNFKPNEEPFSQTEKI
jgi:hypothetical protein